MWLASKTRAVKIILLFLNIFKMYGFTPKTPYESKICSNLHSRLFFSMQFCEWQAPVVRVCDDVPFWVISMQLLKFVWHYSELYVCIYGKLWFWKQIWGRFLGENSRRCWFGKRKSIRHTVQLGCTSYDWCIWKVSGNNISFSIEHYFVNSGRNSQFYWCWRQGFTPQNPHHDISGSSVTVKFLSETDYY